MPLEDYLPPTKEDRKQIGVRLTPEEQVMLDDLREEFQLTTNSLLAALIRKHHDEIFE